MILFKPRLDVRIEKIKTDNHRRCVLIETAISDTKTVFVNIYAPNEPKHQIFFLNELSNSFLKEYINDNVVLGGDFNCVTNSLDKKGGKPFDGKKASVLELQTLIKANNLIDSWRFKNPNSYGFTWSNASKKIQSRLDYLFVSKSLCKLIQGCNILPNTHSDHSAVMLNITFDEDTPTRGPGFWKFNNSLLSDVNYVNLITFSIPEFVNKHREVNDKGLFWEMIKMEIRAFTIKYSKQKAKKMHDEEAALQTELINIQNKLQANYNESYEREMDRLKTKLSRIEAIKTQGTIVRSKARWYEYGEKNSKYFYSLEKTNYRRKHVTSITNHEDKRITDPKQILQEEELYFKEIYTSKNMNPQHPEFGNFFDNIDNTLSQEEAAICEGAITSEECYNALKVMANDKSPGSDGFTAELCRYFWNLISNYMVESFNYAFQNGILSISQRQGVISLIPITNLELLKKFN